jgi:hypothetical protein
VNIPPEFQTLSLYHRNILNCAEHLWNDPSHVHALHVNATKVYTNEETPRRMYQEMWQCDWWIKTEVKKQIRLNTCLMIISFREF